MDIFDKLKTPETKKAEAPILRKLKIAHIKGLYEWQKKVIRSLMDFIDEEEHPAGTIKKIAISGAYGTGKSSLEAMLVPFLLLYLSKRYPKQLIKGTVLSGSEAQGSQVIWSEIERIVTGSRYLDKMLDYNTEKIQLRNSPLKRIYFRTGGSVGREHTVAGVHDDSVIVMVDEATLMSEPLFKKIESFSTKGRTMIVIVGNPIVSGGEFFNAFAPDSEWEAYKISRYDVGGAEDKFAARIKEKYGEDSYDYVTGVLGDFYLKSEGGLFPRYLLDECVSSYIPSLEGAHVIGIDAASGTSRSSTGIVVRNRIGIKELIKRRESTEDTISFCIKLINRYRSKGHVSVVADNNGLGDSVYTGLKMHFKGVEFVEIHGVKAQNAVIKNTSCYNLKTELYYRFRDALKNGCKIPEGYAEAKELYEELANIKLVEKGKVFRVESKKRKDSEEQYDVADAASFTFLVDLIELNRKQDIIETDLWDEMDEGDSEYLESEWL